jgi:uncharacterized protein (TIGR03437 family)
MKALPFLTLFSIFSAAAVAQQINSIVNTSNGAPGVSPGALVTIFGSGLPEVPLDVTLTINGVEAPMFYVTATQINTQIPYELHAGSATVSIQRYGTDVNYNFVLRESSPGIFEDSSGNCISRNADGSFNGPMNPAAPGSMVFVYLSGIGPISHSSVAGELTPGWPLVSAVEPVGASIGGKPARVAFLGLTPGSIGLAQANLIVPKLDGGDYPVTVVIGNRQSNSPVISVAGPR